MNYNMVYGEYMMNHYRAYWEDQVIVYNKVFITLIVLLE